MAYEIIPVCGNAIDISGETFGRLVAIAPVDRTPSSNILWLCICECGSETITTTTSLKQGHTQSCGCLQKERAGPVSTHGMTGNPTYRVWHGMKNRCYNKTNDHFHRYGGRGISVCDQWTNSFIKFLADMGEKPSSSFSIDRIDNNGNYTPENCRWATVEQQQNNRRDSKFITHNGKQLTHAQWSRKIGGNKTLVHTRIKRGWTEERAVTEPARPWRH
jgi:hypothetical protein